MPATPLNLDLSAGPSQASGGTASVGGVTFGDFVFKGAKSTPGTLGLARLALIGGGALLALRLVRK